MTGTFVVDLTGGSGSSLMVAPPSMAWSLQVQDVIAGSAGTIQEWALAL